MRRFITVKILGKWPLHAGYNQGDRINLVIISMKLY